MPDWLVGFIVAVILVVCCIGIPVVYTLGVRQGQIQAINGEVEYELVEQDNGTMRWRKIYE